MDLATIAKILTDQEVAKTLEADNPYRPFGGIADSVGQAILQRTAGGGVDTREAIIGGLLSGMAGGLFSSMGDQYRSDQRTELGKLLTGMGTGESLPKSVQDRVKDTRALSLIGAQLEAQKEKREQEAQLEKIRAEAIANNPFLADEINAALGKRGATSGGVVTMPTTAAGVKPYVEYLRMAGGNEAAANALMQRDLEKPGKDAEVRDALIKEFNALPLVREFVPIATKREALQAIAEDPGALADVPFIYNFMQTIDPGAVVRESDAGMVVESQSAPKALVANINKFLEGKSTLGVEGRKKILGIVDQYYNTAKGQLEVEKYKFGQRAKARGIEDFDVELPGTSVRDLVRQEARAAGIPEELALAVAKTESGFDQSAISPKGALGVMQLMPETAKDLGVDPKNLRENIRGGVRYLAQQLEEFGNPVDALKAYNMGPGALREFKAGKRELPKETADYVQKIQRIMGPQTQAAAAPAGRIQASQVDIIAELVRRGTAVEEIKKQLGAG